MVGQLREIACSCPARRLLVGHFVITPLELRPTPARVLPMLFGMCALVLGAGLVAGDPALAPPLRLLAPIAAALGSAAILALWIRARRARITIDPTAIERIGMLTRERLEWSRITRYRYLFKQRVATLELVTAAGTLRIGGAGYTELGKLMGFVLDELHRRLSRDASFVPFTLDTLSLRDRTGRAVRPGPGLRVTVGDGMLQIADWRPIKMNSVDNVMLLVQLLAARGSMVQIAPEVYVPPAMMSGGAWTSSINTPSPERGATSLPLG